MHSIIFDFHGLFNFNKLENDSKDNARRNVIWDKSINLVRKANNLKSDRSSFFDKTFLKEVLEFLISLKDVKLSEESVQQIKKRLKYWEEHIPKDI